MKRAIAVLVLGLGVLAVMFAAGPSGAADTVCHPDGQIVDPAPFVWSTAGDHFVGVLEYGEASFTIDGESLTTRAYRQEGGCYSIPGPTITMVPGNTYVLRFHNLLPYEAPSPNHNEFKDPNVTNVHTHGLHISGDGAGDDVTRMFEGGRGGDYIYEIPADHMGGTYWYHAHHHGSTFLQVSTGGFGLIVIDDGADGMPANVAAMEERQVVLGYLDPGAKGSGGDTLVDGTLAAGWTVNGNRNGVMTVPPNTWQHWRVLLADRDARMKDVTIGANCEAELLARDGVWRTRAPKDLATNSIELTGASRADLAVRCTSASTISVGGTQVATIEVAGTADPGPHPYNTDGVSQWEANRPDYLRDLRNASNVNRETIRMGARTVNGSKWSLTEPTFTLNADSIQEWSIRGATNHPFHLHVYHFQAMAGCGGDFEEGEYYDTLAASCSVRFDLNAATSTVYSGRTVMHCHILEHEDQGAMTWMDVTGGIAPPTLPSGYEMYYVLGPPPTTTTTATTTTTTSSTTTTTTAAPTSVTVGSVVVTTTNVGQGNKAGQATATVLDNNGNPVSGAVVSGTFSGSINEAATSGPTGANGVTVLQTAGTAKGNVSVTFCATQVTHPTLTDWSGQVCGSS